MLFRSDGNTYADTDEDGNTYADTDEDSNTYADTDEDGNTNAYTYEDSYTHADSYKGAQAGDSNRFCISGCCNYYSSKGQRLRNGQQPAQGSGRYHKRSGVQFISVCSRI